VDFSDAVQSVYDFTTENATNQGMASTIFRDLRKALAARASRQEEGTSNSNGNENERLQEYLKSLGLMPVTYE
jgi:hypothetical protein